MAPNKAHGSTARSCVQKRRLPIVHSTRASNNGSHEAPATIIGCTTETTMKPLNWNTIPATNEPKGPALITRPSTYIQTPASPNCSTMNTPKARGIGITRNTHVRGYSAECWPFARKGCPVNR